MYLGRDDRDSARWTNILLQRQSGYAGVGGGNSAAQYQCTMRGDHVQDLVAYSPRMLQHLKSIRLQLRPPYRNVPFDRGGDQVLSSGATALFRASKAGDNPAAIKLLLSTARRSTCPPQTESRRS